MVHRRAPIPRGTEALCQRCGGELYSNRTTDIGQLLAISITALIVFVIANFFPIVHIELGGEQSGTTLWGAIMASYESGMAFIAGISAAVVFFFPLLLILLCLYIFLPLRMNISVPGFVHAMRLLRQVRPWSMIEVFSLGVLVALVKLSADAEISAAAGLWGFAALTLLLPLLNGIDMQELWDFHERGAS